MTFTKILTALFFLLFGINGLYAQSGKNLDEFVLKTRMDSIAYSIGTQLGSSLKNDSLYINVDILKVGITDAFQNKEPRLTIEQMSHLMESLGAELQEKQMKAQKKAADEAKSLANKFLEENKKKEGVKVTASGLQYKVVNPGAGDKPSAKDTVEVHYHGTLVDGSVFDSSVERGEPVAFPLDRVIPGWTEGVQLMPKGAKYIFYIPSELAYGEHGAGSIGPNQTLIFEVELLDIRKAK